MYYIYKIHNGLFHKSYIGMTGNYEKRIAQHKAELESNAHPCAEMQLDYNSTKFRNGNYIKCEMLAQCENKEIAQDLEYLFIYKEIARNRKVYNKVQLSFPISLFERDIDCANEFIDNRTFLHAYFNKEFGDVAFIKFCKAMGREYLIDLLEMTERE